MPLPHAFEQLEPRSLLSAPTVMFVSASNNDTGVFVQVDYASDVGLNFSTLGHGDLIAISTGHPTLSANLFGKPSTQINGTTRAIYLFSAPEGAWNWNDSGDYVITSPPGEVQDTQGQNLQSSAVHTLGLFFSQPHATIPTQTVRTNDWLIVVNYTDNTGINRDTIDATDISVEGPGLFGGITLQQTIVNSPSNVTAVYRIPAPTNGWNYQQNGDYTIRLNANAVKDNTNLAPATHAMRSFGLFFYNPAAVALGPTVRGDDLLVPVRFSGLAPINASTITNGVATLTSPNGYSQSGAIYTTTPGAGGSQTVVFRFLARGGTWDYTDNADYTLSLASNTVKDTSNRSVNGGALVKYGLFFNNPAATVASAYATNTRFDLFVQFHDNGTIDNATITSNAISLTGPTPVTITLVSIANDPVRGTRAYFRITPVSGTLANGGYILRTVANQVRDTQNFAVNAGQIQEFGLFF